MIYLASPYSHPDPKVREFRFQEVCRMAGDIMLYRGIVYSPIAHTHPIAVQCELPTGWGFWQELDRKMISVCAEVWIYTLDGWDQSNGIKGEIKIAKELDKPLYHVNWKSRQHNTIHVQYVENR